MTATRITVELDEAARDLVVDALRTDSRRRQRAATKAAAELDSEKRSGQRRDIRSGAVMVTAMLVEASKLDAAADAIATAPREAAQRPQERPEPQNGVTTPGDTVEAASGPQEAPSEDGRRTVEDALAETADVLDTLGMRVTAADLTDTGDLDDGAIPEDNPTPAELDDVDLAAQEV